MSNYCGKLNPSGEVFCMRARGHEGSHRAEADAGERDRRGNVVLRRVKWGEPAVSELPTSELFDRLRELEPVEDEGWEPYSTDRARGRVTDKRRAPGSLSELYLLQAEKEDGYGPRS
jgi:hypothetical protein